MMEHDKMNVETALAGPSVTSARVAASQKKRKKEERGNSLFSERSGKNGIRAGKRSEKGQNGRKTEKSLMERYP